MSEGVVKRLPWPALAVIVVVLAVVHGPLLSSPWLLEDASLLHAGDSAGRFSITRLWLDLEASLGANPRVHHLVGLLLELLTAVLLVLVAWKGGLGGAAVVLAGLAYLLHPLRTGVVVRPGHRGLVLAEVLLASGLLLLFSRSRARRHLAVLPALLAGFLAPAMAPLGLVVLGLAFSSRGALRAAVLALATGAAVGWIDRELVHSSGSTASSLGVASAWLLPWSVSLLQPAGAEPWWCAAALGAAILLSLPCRRLGATPWLCLLATVLAISGAPHLPHDRITAIDWGRGTPPELALGASAALCCLWLSWWRAAALPRALVTVLALTILASGWLRVRDFASEVRLLEQAIASDPERAEYRRELARSLLRRLEQVPDPERHDLATRALNEATTAVRLRPADDGAGAAKALALAWLRKFAEAREELDSRLLRHPGDPRLLKLRGQIELMAGRLLEALRWFRSALRVEGSAALQETALAILAQAHAEIDRALRQSDHALARQLCDELLKVVPEDRVAAEARASTFQLEGDETRAEQEFEAVLRGHPESLVALRALIQLLEKRGEAEQAEEYRRRLFTLGGRAQFE